MPPGPCRRCGPVTSLETYDGREVVEVARDALRWLGPHGSGWRVAWSEVEGEQAAVLRVARDPGALAVLLASRRDLQLWRWALPSRTLRARTLLRRKDDVLALLPTGVRAVRGADGAVEWLTADDHLVHRVLAPADAPAPVVVGVGGGWAATGPGGLALHAGPTEPAAAVLTRPPTRRRGDCAATATSSPPAPPTTSSWSTSCVVRSAPTWSCARPEGPGRGPSGRRSADGGDLLASPGDVVTRARLDPEGGALFGAPDADLHPAGVDAADDGAAAEPQAHPAGGHRGRGEGHPVRVARTVPCASMRPRAVTSAQSSARSSARPARGRPRRPRCPRRTAPRPGRRGR